MTRLLEILLVIYLLASPSTLAAGDESVAPETTPQESADFAMDNERLQRIIERVDPEYSGQPGFWRLLVADIPLQVVTDEKNDRMRIVIPIRKADELSAEDMYRLLQANFDTALDARYAIAQGVLWSTYLHPLSTLTDEDFLSGMGQAINIVTTYGKTYSSGGLTFGGGDSGELLEKELIEELKKRGKII